MSTSDKMTSKICQSILRGEIDPSKVNGIEKRLGITLALSQEQVAWATLVYANRLECANNN